jgi:hypothetical protein
LRAAEALYSESLENNASRIQQVKSDLDHCARSLQHYLTRRCLGFNPEIGCIDQNRPEVEAGTDKDLVASLRSGDGLLNGVVFGLRAFSSVVIHHQRSGECRRGAEAKENRREHGNATKFH